jgi:hypothetical protein
VHPLRKAFANPQCPLCGGSVRVLRPHVFDSVLASIGLEFVFWLVFVVLAAALAHWLRSAWAFAAALAVVYPFVVLVECELSGFRCYACSRQHSFREVRGVGWRLYPFHAR